MITEIEEYFAKGCGRCERFATLDCSVQRWSDGLDQLRRLCLGSGLLETVKWAHPCYVHRGRNIAILGAFRGDFRISFFNAALMQDPEHVLETPGPNTRYPSIIRFVDPAGVTAMEKIVLSYLKEAMGYAEAGIKPPKEASDADLPDELLDVMDSDPELAEAFRKLTLGRQKSYVINLASAKKSETGTARILSFRNHILAGKGATER